MKLFTLIAITIYCCVSLFMAVRLILLARRTRELPELLIGLAFLSGGMFGYPFSVAAGILRAASMPQAANITYIVAQAGMASAAFFVLLAWRRIFAPEMRGGGALVSGWAVLLLASFIGVVATKGPDSSSTVLTGFSWFLLISQAGCYGLIAWSGHVHARMLARRCVLGLADPVIANRLLLWGLSNSVVTISYLYTMGASLLIQFGGPNLHDPSVIAACGLLAACGITLGFFPPRAYEQWIRARFADRTT